MEIGLFQLENLIISRSPFTFLDLRREQDPSLPQELAKLLVGATRVRPEEVHAHLGSGSKERAIVLVCEDGSSAHTVTAELEARGFTNVYMVAGGVVGLLSEL